MNRKRNRFCVSYFIAATLVVCPLWNASVIGDVNLVELAKKVRPSVVLIEAFDKNKKRIGQGSGFFIDDRGHLITNYHVLDGAYSAEVKTFNGKVYPVKLVIAERKETDLIKVLVDIPKKSIKFVPVTKIVPQVAERVLVVGSPMGLDQTVSEGIVSAVRDIPSIGKIFQISAPISPGSSGSPVVNMEGKVIGVASFQFVEGQNLNFAVSGEQVLDLKSEKKSKTVAEWTDTVSLKNMNSAEKLYLEGMKYLLWASEYEKALGFFTKALEKNSRFAEAWYWSAWCYGWLDRYEAAIKAFKQAISTKPDYLYAWNDLGGMYDKLGRYVEAIEACKQAIHIDPNLPEPYHNLGNAYLKLDRHEEAIEVYKKAILMKDFARTHLDFAKTYYYLACAYAKLDRDQEALQAYREAIRINADFVEPYWRLGIHYAALGRYQEALGAYKQAIRIKPDLAEPHYWLGLTYLLVGDKGLALEEYKILKTLDKDLANKLFDLIYK